MYEAILVCYADVARPFLAQVKVDNARLTLIVRGPRTSTVPCPPRISRDTGEIRGTFMDYP